MKTQSLHKSIWTDSYWSALSFFLIVVSGLFLNAGIAQSFGRTGLGIFNTCLSAVLILGQLGGLGINAAVTFEVPSAKSKNEPYKYILKTALFSTLMTSTLVSVLFITIVELLVASNESGYLSGLRLVYVAVFLLPFNKVLVAYLNGVGDIKKAALANASRFLLMLIFLGIISNTSLSWQFVSIVISMSEITLFIGLIMFVRSDLWNEEESKDSFQIHQRSIMSFGLRSIPAVFLLDMNTRVDVLLLSVLMGAEVVGQYTVASTFSEGLFQMAMVTRLVVDPRIAGLNALRRTEELSQFLKRHITLTYIVMVPVISASFFLFTPVVEFLFSKENASGSLEVYAFLAAGILLTSGFIPLTNLLNQMGAPFRQSMLLTCVTVINIVGNLFLIPPMGASGAALATAFSQVMFVPLLLVFAGNKSGILRKRIDK